MIIGFIFLFAACNKEANSEIERPNLGDTTWTYLSVDYCIGDSVQVDMKNWTTRDPVILEHLKSLFEVASIDWLSLICEMTTNKLELGTDDEHSWIMYIFEIDEITIYDSENPTASYSLNINPVFYHELKKYIETEEGMPIYFYYDKEVKIRK